MLLWYRPGRNPHLALKALRDHLVTGKVRHVYEADIQGYFITSIMNGCGG